MYKIIGSEKIKDYQITLIAMGIFILVLLGPFYIIDKNIYSLIVLLIGVAFVLSFSVAYSKLYKIEFNGNHFKISNLFSKKEEYYSNLKGVSIKLKIPFVLCISFKGGRKYYFMLNSKDNITIFFRSKDEILSNVKRQIDDMVLNFRDLKE